jgi:hypothetical protein
VFIRAFLPRGLRVLGHSRGVIVRNGVVVRRLTKLRRGKAQTIRLALVPRTSGRRCSTVTANAILRKQHHAEPALMSSPLVDHQADLVDAMLATHSSETTNP